MYPGGNVIKITPTLVDDDNADNDVAFNWTELKSVSNSRGAATHFKGITMYDADDSAAGMEFVFCRGSYSSSGGTSAPTTAQNLQDGADGSAAIDMTGAEGQAIQICGALNVAKSAAKGDLIGSSVISAAADFLMQPNPDSTSLFISGIWRDDPAATASTDSLDVYVCFEYLG